MNGVMKRAILIGVIAALGACNQPADAPETAESTATGAIPLTGDEAGFEAVAPGEYEVVHKDGTIDRMTIHPGMTWSLVYSNGDAAGGTIFAQDGKNCFVTEGVEGHRCFTEGPTQPDGSMQVTAEDGEVTTVRPVAGTSASPEAGGE